jgi:hypothetical protein
MTSQPPSQPEQEEQWARVRGYLLSQTEKYDLVDLWPRVIAERLNYLQAIEGVTDAQAAWRPGHGEGEDAWSILEITQHITTWTRNVVAMLEAMSQGQEGSKLPPGYLDADLTKSLAQSRRELIEATMGLSVFMARPNADKDLSMTVEHPFFGPLTIRGWALFQRVHDVDHVAQVNTLKAMEQFPAAAK